MNSATKTAVLLAGAIAGLALIDEPATSATSTRYALTSVALLDAPGGKTIGTITPGTAATVDAQQSGASKVTIAGFAPSGSGSLLYAAAGQRILLVGAMNASAAKLALNGTPHDVGGAPWRAATVQGYIGDSGLGNSATPVWKAAQTLFAARCSTCHALPAETAYAPNAWPGLVKAMVHNAGLSADQTVLITKYLQTVSLAKGR